MIGIVYERHQLSIISPHHSKQDSRGNTGYDRETIHMAIYGSISLIPRYAQTFSIVGI